MYYFNIFCIKINVKIFCIRTELHITLPYSRGHFNLRGRFTSPTAVHTFLCPALVLVLRLALSIVGSPTRLYSYKIRHRVHQNEAVIVLVSLLAVNFDKLLFHLNSSLSLHRLESRLGLNMQSCLNP